MQLGEVKGSDTPNIVRVQLYEGKFPQVKEAWKPRQKVGKRDL